MDRVSVIDTSRVCVCIKIFYILKSKRAFNSVIITRVMLESTIIFQCISYTTQQQTYYIIYDVIACYNTLI